MPYEKKAAPDTWVLSEPIDITVTSSFAGDGGHSDDHLELFVTRVSNKEESYILRVNWNGEISVDNSYWVDLGDDYPAYTGIFDAVEEAANKNSDAWVVPPVGFRLRIDNFE